MLDAALTKRANSQCELCGDANGLTPCPVPPDAAADADRHLLACAICAAQLSGAAELDAKHWFCLQEAIWSEIPAVQITAWRLLNRLNGESWAADLLDQAYLDDETMAWAKAGLEADDDSDAKPRTVDSNGTELHDGDAVSLIKSLDVKGAGFTAKRGTVVKGIRLTDDPTHIEGKVNKVGIFLKTCFLKKIV